MIDVMNRFISAGMTYTSWTYFVLTAVVLMLYYVVPKKYQWMVLLFGSGLFYYCASVKNPAVFLVFLITIGFSFFGGKILGQNKSKKMFIIIAGVSLLPLLIVKGNDFIAKGVFGHPFESIVVPLGLSFYSLQIYAYLYDVYQNRTEPQNNILKYALFISWFPQIMQGPIPRYSQLGEQLFSGHEWNTERIVKGLQLVLWGFFLKYLIAEKAAVIVNAVFNQYEMYQGAFVLAAGCLYSIQLYTDFLACVCMSKGVSEMFDIRLADNFMRPYRASSIKDFWRRWHISLSSWLRDYVYIPLGGSRKGTVRKYGNLLITFVVSGIWHGSGYRFILWGIIHAFYQIMGDLLKPFNTKVKQWSGIQKDSIAETVTGRIITFILVMLAWIVFRAESLTAGVKMVSSIFLVHNEWILFDDSLLTLGLDWKEFVLLLVSIYFLFRIESLQEKMVIRDKIMEQPLFVRWLIYLTAAAVIIVFGTYGFGFQASDFIYRGF